MSAAGLPIFSGAMKPLIGISCCTKQFGVFATANHAVSDTYVRAVDELLGAVPVLIPANGHTADPATLVSRLDGIILTGSRSNVQPAAYGGPPHPDGTPEDAMRDAVTLPLIRAAIDAGVPVFAICRGMQELNVALGGSLYQRLQDLPGRIDHSTPMQPCARVRTAKAHIVRASAGGWLHRLVGAEQFAVNSLHNQGVARLAEQLTVEAVAPDGTIEAVRVLTTSTGRPAGYAVGVQWHPEYDYAEDRISRRLIESFWAALRGEAIRAEPLATAAE